MTTVLFLVAMTCVVALFGLALRFLFHDGPMIPTHWRERPAVRGQRPPFLWLRVWSDLGPRERFVGPLTLWWWRFWLVEVFYAIPVRALIALGVWDVPENGYYWQGRWRWPRTMGPTYTRSWRFVFKGMP